MAFLREKHYLRFRKTLSERETMEKKELRNAMRGRNRALGEAERNGAAARIFAAVERTEAFRRAHTVALFSALGDEPPTAGALERWAREKRILLPRVSGDEMEFFPYRPGELASGSFGILEPQRGAPCTPAEIDLVIVPGVAFTRSGGRLGRGRGYYDKYLSRSGFRAMKIGVCYAHQLVDALPEEPHDVRMDEVIAAPPV